MNNRTNWENKRIKNKQKRNNTDISWFSSKIGTYIQHINYKIHYKLKWKHFQCSYHSSQISLFFSSLKTQKTKHVFLSSLAQDFSPHNTLWTLSLNYTRIHPLIWISIRISNSRLISYLLLIILIWIKIKFE